MEALKKQQHVIRNEMTQLFKEPGFRFPNARWFELESRLREVESKLGSVDQYDHRSLVGLLVDHP